ncbi:hypothetical protein E1A91_D12G140000v1 [Gossypium mustelinum]|uniref:Uncharacterized protein n=1 Tax=Gossypium mustelinum TaxID=34275 RepID=A0A5D2SDN9_GOSMU|nr:hypothetical protein E1A91_D12G140000v1 [Gossypium mustelinum]
MGSVGCSQASADCYLWLHTVYVPFQVERKVVQHHNRLLPCLLPSSSVYYFSSRFF